MIELLQKLIQAESTPSKGELAVSKVISDEFTRYGIDCHIDSWDQNRANCVAHVKSPGQRRALLFVCHHDVVPPGEATWQHPPFSGLEQAGKIFGRGATDMKGGIAAAITAIGQIITQGVPLQGDIVFAATAGEETDSCGVKRFVENSAWLPELAGVVIPEPTGFDIINAHRGLLWLNIITAGKTAHGSAPHLGINAIDSMKMVLNALDDFKINVEPHPHLGACSMSVNTIQGGKALNVVPDQCTLGVDIRTLPLQDHQTIIQRLEEMLARLVKDKTDFSAGISLVRSVPALETDADKEFVQRLKRAVGIEELKAVGFTTDGPYLCPLNVPILIFGPGDGSMCHQPNEFIRIDAVEKAVDYYSAIIKTFLT